MVGSQLVVQYNVNKSVRTVFVASVTPPCQTSQRAYVPNVLMWHSAHIPRPQVPGAPTSLCNECRVSPRARRPHVTGVLHHNNTVTPRVFGYPCITKPDYLVSSHHNPTRAGCSHITSEPPRAGWPHVPKAPACPLS
jgi:hypothetical protein